MIAHGDHTQFGVDLTRLQLRSRRMVSADMLGNYRSSFKGSGLVYSDLREYQPGDDVKHIHWKVSARTDKVFVKSYEEERQLRVMLAVDTSPSMRAPFFRPVFPRVLEFASLIATITQRSNDLLGAALFTDQIFTLSPPSASPARHHRILTLLTDAQKAPFTPKDDAKVVDGDPANSKFTHVQASNLKAVCSDLLVTLKRPTLLFILSDFFSPPFDFELSQLAKRHDVVLVHFSDSVDTLPRAGLVTFTDPESGATSLIDTRSQRVRHALGELFSKRKEQISAIAKTCGADLVHIENSVVNPLAKLMNERARKGQLSQRRRAR